MKRDINGEVAGYRGLVESLAPKFVGRNGAELDDLVQEGLVFVWQSLERGIQPVPDLIEGRMKSWVRLLGYQTGKVVTKEGEAVEYAQLLPLDDYVAEHYIMGIDGYPALPNVGPDDLFV